VAYLFHLLGGSFVNLIELEEALLKLNMEIKTLKDHHHYKGNGLSRTEKIERRVVEMIFASKKLDDKSESSKVWELKHSSGCCQIARVLAEIRGLDVEIAETAAVLHDVYVIVEGTYKNHAKSGAPIAEKILRENGGFLKEDIQTISAAIAHHSEKEVYSNDPYVELIKDVDVFDCSLYKNAERYYRLHKSEQVVKEYINRIKKVREELGLPPENIFRQ